MTGIIQPHTCEGRVGNVALLGMIFMLKIQTNHARARAVMRGGTQRRREM